MTEKTRHIFWNWFAKGQFQNKWGYYIQYKKNTFGCGWSFSSSEHQHFKRTLQARSQLKKPKLKIPSLQDNRSSSAIFKLQRLKIYLYGFKASEQLSTRHQTSIESSNIGWNLSHTKNIHNVKIRNVQYWMNLESSIIGCLKTSKIRW